MRSKKPSDRKVGYGTSYDPVLFEYLKAEAVRLSVSFSAVVNEALWAYYKDRINAPPSK